MTAEWLGRKCSRKAFSAARNCFSTGDRNSAAKENSSHAYSAPWSASIASGHTRTFVICTMGLVVLFAAPQRSRAQLSQPQAPPSWGKVPQGTNACSVEKSCADLAPGMIRDALGASPLDQNIHALTKILSAVSDVPSAEARAAGWTKAALQRSGADEVHVEKVGSPGAFEVVVAEIRGRDLPRDYILLAAPVFEIGAAPRAVAENAAVLIDAVRVIHATGNIPRRSIRFVFFPVATQSAGGKLAALWAYIREHRAHLNRIAAAVSIDAASGPPDGYSLEDRPETLSAVREALEPLRSLGIRNFSEGVPIEADATPFWLEGIPTLVGTSTGDKLTSGDSPRATSNEGSLDSARLQQLKRGVAVAAVTAYALADAQTRIGRRRSPLEVRHSIDSLGIESQLKAAGVWAQWQALEAPEKH